jgi:8-oxo-dGTP diphosphatase
MDHRGLAMKHAVVAVIRRAGRVLVIQRGPGASFAGYWSPPSGRIEAGETQPEAVAREMHEELGLEVRPVAKVWECPTDDGEYLLHWWTVEEDGAVLAPDPREVGAVLWVDSEAFLRLEATFQGDRVFFATVLPHLTSPLGMQTP